MHCGGVSHTWKHSEPLKVKDERLRFEFEGNGMRKKLFVWKKFSPFACGLGPHGQASNPSQHKFEVTWQSV